MPLAAGIETIVGIKKETTPGTIAGASGAQLLRRVNAAINLTKDTYQAAEKVSHAQVQDMRHGVRRVAGSIDGELSPATFKLFMQSLLRRDFTTGATTGAIVTVTAAAGPPGTFTRSSGSFLADGFKIGDVVNWTGWATTGAANNARNYRITALTATVMTVTGTGNEVVAAKASGDSVTCTVVGKKTWTPTTGLTFDAYTIEKWFPDIAQSERYVGCRIVSMRLSLPATGMCTVSFGLVGKDLQTGTAAYFTTPTAVTSTGLTAAVNGFLRAGSSDLAIVTGVELTVEFDVTGDPVVGANTIPQYFAGKVRVSGQLTAYFEDATLRDAFINETAVTLAIMLTTTNDINSPFLSFVMSRVKLGGADKTDPDGGAIQTLPFTALLDTAGGAGIATEATTLSIQDSAA